MCIPTYKRPHLLKLLIGDIVRQSLRPNYIIVIDGDPASEQVKQVLSNEDIGISTIYIPSNHGNLSYQRYLGWKVANRLDVETVIYFDDDERLLLAEILTQLTDPFLTSDDIVGVGCKIRFGQTNDNSDAALARSQKTSLIFAPLTKIFGSGRGLQPGSITPTGNRVALVDDGSTYVATTWLHGGVMAYRMSALSNDIFSDDLFALDHIRCGLGEDTFLSRRVAAKGSLKYTFRVAVEHPNVDTPKSYPSDAYRFAYAVAYSRRFQNDYYRVYEPPHLSDRIALIKSYAGNILLAWTRTLTKPTRLHWALARGTTLGAIHGLTRSPTAKRLTPHIDWWADAEEALSHAETIG